MSARSRSVALAREAQADLREALAFTQRRWGVQQRNVYRHRIMDALGRIAEFPDMGMAAGELGEGRRRLRVDDHVVIYRMTADEVRVGRLIHVRRDRHPAGDEEPG